MDGSNTQLIHEHERKLFTELQEAREAYDSANKEYKRLLEYCKDLGLAHPDGHTALRQATAIQRSALERYTSVLHAFTDFVMRGKATGF